MSWSKANLLDDFINSTYKAFLTPISESRILDKFFSFSFFKSLTTSSSISDPAKAEESCIMILEIFKT